MALSYATYVTAGSVVDYTFDKGYLQQSDVSVYLNGVLQTLTSDYTWFNATTVRLNSYPGDGVTVRIERNTPNTARLVDFQDAGNLTEADLDLNSDQLFYLAQEGTDEFSDLALSLDTDDKWNAESKVIKNVTDPTNAQDAATKAYGDANWGGTAAAAAAASAAAALASETAADASETAAAASEAAAAASAVAAAASAVDAANASTEQINPVINGQFDIWQRGASITNIQNGQFGADRWFHARDGSGATVNFTRNTWSPGHASNTWGAPYYAIFNCTVAGTGETYNNIQQRFEDVGLFDSQEVTLSFVAHSPLGDQVIDSIIWLQNFGSGGSTQVVTTISSGTETISGSGWSEHTITFTPPSISGKTIGTDANSRIVFQIAANATFNVYLANVQIDVGPNAKAIKRADIPTEMMRCQRFYQKSYHVSTNPGTATSVGSNTKFKSSTIATTEVREFQARFPVAMRTTPTMTWYSPATGASGKVRQVDGGGAEVTVSSTAEASSGSTGFPVLSSGISDTYRVSAHWTADAEL